VANWKGIKTRIINALPEWAKVVPYQVKSVAIRDACKAVNNAKIKYLRTGVYNEVKFRSRKKKKENLFIPSSAVKKLSFYRTLIGEIYSSEDFDGNDIKDCRVVCQSGRYFIIIPKEVSIEHPENQRIKVVALDPGVRTFQTFYSQELAGKIGNLDFGKIQRLCSYLDLLISKISKAKMKQKYRMKKAADRIRWRIKDLISEIHYKTANFLCKNFDVIVLPSFEVSQMVSKLRSKTSRAMLTWSHYRFSQILIAKAKEYFVTVIRQNEAYTSKTCSACGKVQNIGSKKELKCSCGLVIDRDYNGARGILLRALGDTPWLRDQFALVNNIDFC
jgi:putative transposase